ncbi:YncE family protein [Alkalibacillus haloalkaliphilus]|uniref:YncE family protein n=1 Tax=Alkalibacillus haloalkaliphilus TaxID=94136 RepID=UPI0029355788|nr:hypothetical protein [Alkalibacillus haloalkaliphilus]MDV2583035.1 hypothetical protein [Alkalibacillus haloalkaliphilus]
MKKILFSITVISLFIIFISVNSDTQAVSDDIIQLDDENLIEWVLSEDEDTIYAITSSGTLHEISVDSFEIKSSINMDGDLADLYLYENSLYIALTEESLIKEVDLPTMEVVQSIDTLDEPITVAATSEAIYYFEDQHSNLYKYGLETGEQEEISAEGMNGSFYNPKVSIDYSTDMMYVGDTGSSGSDLHAVSLADYTIQHNSTFKDGYGFSYARQAPIVDGDDTFYAGFKMNKHELAEIRGLFAPDFTQSMLNSNRVAEILDVDEDYVYSTNHVYDRETYRKVETLPDGITHAFSINSELILYNSNNNSIVKNQVNYEEPSFESVYSNGKLGLNDGIEQWIYDEDEELIYALSGITHNLVIIDPETMEVLGTKFVGSYPTNFDLIDGKLYIALAGATKIAVTEPDLNSDVEYIITKHNPYDVGTDGENLYYVTLDQSGHLHYMDLISNEENILQPRENTNQYRYREPSIVLSDNGNELFLAESSTTGSRLYVISTEDGEQLQESDRYSLPKRILLTDDDYYYFAEHRFGKDDILGDVEEILTGLHENFVAVDDQYIYSDQNIYDKNIDEVIFTLPEDYDLELATMTINEEIFLGFSEINNIYKFNSMEDLINRKVENVDFHDNESEYQLTWDAVTGDGYIVYAKHDEQEDFEPISDLITDEHYTLAADQVDEWMGREVTFGVKSVFGDIKSEEMDTVDHHFEIPVPQNVEITVEDTSEELKDEVGNKIYSVSWDFEPKSEGYSTNVVTKDGEVVINYDIDYDMFPDRFEHDGTFFGELLLSDYTGETLFFEMAFIVNDQKSEFSERVEFTVEEPVDQEEESNEEGSEPEQEESTSDDSSEEESSSEENQDSSSNDENTEEVDENDEGSSSNGRDDTQGSNNENSTGDSSQSDQGTEPTRSENYTLVPDEDRNGVFVLPDDGIDQVEEDDNVDVDLGDGPREEARLLFSARQITTLVERNNEVTLHKQTTNITIPASNFHNFEDTLVTMSKLEPFEEAVSDVYDFTIGQGDDFISEFVEPVTLSFQVDVDKLNDPDNAKIHYLNDETDEWELIGGTYEDGYVTGETDHFSTFAVFEVSAEEDEEEVEETNEEVTEEESDEEVENTQTDSEDETNFSFVWIVLALIVIVGLIALYFVKRK